MSFWDFLKRKKVHTLNVDQHSKEADTTIDNSSSEEKVQISITAKSSECSESDDSISKPSVEPDDPDFPCIRLLMRLRNTWVKDAVKEFDLSLIQKHIDADLLALSSLEMDLKAYTIPDLKEFLSQNNLKVSGKKSDLVHRLMENLSEDQIRTFAPDSYYYLTQKGKKTIEDLENAKLQKEIAPIQKIASLISSHQFDSATSFLYPNQGNSFGQIKFDIYPEAIAYCHENSVISDALFFAVIDRILYGYSSNNTFSHLRYIGYDISDISNDNVITALTACRSSSRLLDFKKLGPDTKYRIVCIHDAATCASCSSKTNRSYLVSEAKFGINLPPFCEECRCRIVLDASK